MANLGKIVLRLLIAVAILTPLLFFYQNCGSKNAQSTNSLSLATGFYYLYEKKPPNALNPTECWDYASNKADVEGIDTLQFVGNGTVTLWGNYPSPDPRQPRSPPVANVPFDDRFHLSDDLQSATYRGRVYLPKQPKPECIVQLEM